MKTSVASLSLRLRLTAPLAWAAILGLIALALGGLAMQVGPLLQLLYPLAACAVGGLLYWRYPTLYLGFAWWIWFLTPEVRRLVDYEHGWNPVAGSPKVARISGGNVQAFAPPAVPMFKRWWALRRMVL